MVLRFFPLAITFLFISCTDFERNNPDDPDSPNYIKYSSTPSSSSIRINVVFGPSVYYEGETYETVVIGTQTWFKRNLNYNANGSVCYNNSTSNCDKFGRLYNWATAMGLATSCNSSSCSSQINAKQQGVCPSGWHIPSNADWDKLVRYVDGTNGTSSPYYSFTAGRYLKATSGWADNGNGEDWYGFSALPGGDGYFRFIGEGGYWWSASEYDNKFAYFRYMLSKHDHVGYDNVSFDKSDLLSIRCLQDNSIVGISSSSMPSSSSVVSSSSIQLISSSSAQSSSSEVQSQYTFTCKIPENSIFPAAVKIPEEKRPELKCKDKDGNDVPLAFEDIGIWTNAPDWRTPRAGEYDNIQAKVSNDAEGCNGIKAECEGKITITGGSSFSSSSNTIVYGPSVYYEGETYATVVIGEQTWFQRNLNYNVNGSKCYNDDTSNCVMYGRLYDWATAMALAATCNSNSCSSQINTPHQGICPAGWHLPSDAEWDALLSYIEINKGCSNCDAKHLKSTSGWYDGGNGLDSYGFSALPGGDGNSDGYFGNVGINGIWWSSSEYNSDGAYGEFMFYDLELVVSYGIGVKSGLFSVRCLQD